jgi:PilZ domain
MEERRKSERIQTRLHAQWETHSGVLEGTIINCSVGGCFVEGEVEEPGDEPVKLTIRLPNGTFVQLWGTVAFHLPTMGFGLHFTHSSDDDQLMFDKWLNYLEAQKAAVPIVRPSTATAA